jgi:topoisomerase IV subunit B
MTDDALRPPATVTHDWRSSVDRDHLDDVRARAEQLTPGGLLHLIAEAVAYPAEEAQDQGRGRCEVTLSADGSVIVADSGRGTATVLDRDGRPVRKPVMATQDVRFFGADDPPLLPDGHPRRGMSVVAALSLRLTHTNRRVEGAWTQVYEHGIPASELVPLSADGSTGTIVEFSPDPERVPVLQVSADDVRRWAASWPALDLVVHDRRPHPGARPSHRAPDDH